MKNWKAIAGVILVFVLGLVTGGLVVGRVVKQRIHRAAAGGSVFTSEEITRHLARRLDLDAAQREQVRQIVAETQAEIHAARQAVEPAVRQAIRDGVADVRAVLRPEQQEQFTRLVAERFLKGRQ